MRKALVYVEGYTEERFVRDLLAPHLLRRGLILTPTLAKTKRTKSGPDFKGGITSYPRVRREIERLLGDTSVVLVTTMIDFYSLPVSFPGVGDVAGGTCYERVEFLEQQLSQDIGDPRFRAYLQLHEFEALLFSNLEELDGAFPDAEVLAELRRIRGQFGSPEEIDDGQTTAPSKRLLSLLPEYQKALHGPRITRRIGLERLRNECPHFARWLEMLEGAF